jgi:CRP-like cAMP-binding protein
MSSDGQSTYTRDRQSALRKEARHRHSDVMTALESLALFSLCSRRELKEIAKAARMRSVRAGTTLIVEGEHESTMFVIVSGGCDVRRANRKIANLGPGDVVGELAVLGKAPRNATVIARTDSDIAIITKRDVYKLIEDAPGFSRKLLEGLANRVRELDRQLLG